MKSKRAQKELEKLEKFYPFSGWIAPSDTYRIAEIAEQEAEERMQKKAISAFDDMWFENGEDGEFEPDYEYHRKNFIQKLNENEND
jgi:hypothetical protein